MEIGVPEKDREQGDSEKVGHGGKECCLEDGGADDEVVSGTEGFQDADLTALMENIDVHDHRNDYEYRDK